MASDNDFCCWRRRLINWLRKKPTTKKLTVRTNATKMKTSTVRKGMGANLGFNMGGWMAKKKKKGATRITINNSTTAVNPLKKITPGNLYCQAVITRATNSTGSCRRAIPSGLAIFPPRMLVTIRVFMINGRAEMSNSIIGR